MSQEVWNDKVEERMIPDGYIASGATTKAGGTCAGRVMTEKGSLILLCLNQNEQKRNKTKQMND